MRKLLSCAVFGIALLYPYALQASSPPSDLKQVEYPPLRVESKPIYQEGEKVEVTLHELFPHSCYRSGPAEVHVSGYDIYVRNLALLYDGYICLTALYPHAKNVDVGALPAGTYRILVKDGPSTREETQFSVAPAL